MNDVRFFRGALFAFCLLHSLRAPAVPRPRGDEPLVDLHKVEPGIAIELRYATPRNVLGKALYPPGAPCLVREGVAQWLRFVQYLLRKQGFGLKIWDAYRPPAVQQQLFDFIKRPEFVADPSQGGALHTWGVAVDATLVDLRGREVPMPTDFDQFSRTAALHYAGGDPVVLRNLDTLQRAMGTGFYGMHGEWWHFIAKNWAEYGPVRTLPPGVPAAWTR